VKRRRPAEVEHSEAGRGWLQKKMRSAMPGVARHERGGRAGGSGHGSCCNRRVSCARRSRSRQYCNHGAAKRSQVLDRNLAKANRPICLGRAAQIRGAWAGTHRGLDEMRNMPIHDIRRGEGVCRGPKYMQRHAEGLGSVVPISALRRIGRLRATQTRRRALLGEASARRAAAAAVAERPLSARPRNCRSKVVISTRIGVWFEATRKNHRIGSTRAANSTCRPAATAPVAVTRIAWFNFRAKDMASQSESSCAPRIGMCQRHHAPRSWAFRRRAYGNAPAHWRAPWLRLFTALHVSRQFIGSGGDRSDPTIGRRWLPPTTQLLRTARRRCPLNAQRCDYESCAAPDDSRCAIVWENHVWCARRYALWNVC